MNKNKLPCTHVITIMASISLIFHGRVYNCQDKVRTKQNIWKIPLVKSKI